MVTCFRTFNLFALLFLGLIAASQSEFRHSFNADWDVKNSPEFYEGQEFPEYIERDPMLDGLPVYFQDFKLRGDYKASSIRIISSSFEPVKSTGLTKTQERHITSDIQANARISYGGNKAYCSVSIIPFRKNSRSGQFERLTSVEYELVNTPGTKPKQRAGVEESVLAEGSWYKIAVGDDGVYRINYDFLTSLGIDVSNLSTDNINIYGSGGWLLPFDNSEFRYDDLVENSIFVNDANDNGQFESADYILFYGRGANKWEYFDDPVAGRDRFVHNKHYYSDSGYYFIRVDDDLPKRIENAAVSQETPDFVTTSFNDRQFLEKEISNLAKSGREFYGENFDLTTTQQFSFSTPNLTNDSALLVVKLASRSVNEASSFTVSSEGTSITEQIASVGTSSTSYYAQDETFYMTIFPSGSTVDVNIVYNKANAAAEGWLDYLQLNVRRQLQMNTAQLAFRDTSAYGPGTVTRFEINEAWGVHEIWDVTDIANVQRIPFELNDETASFTVETNELREFIAFQNNNYKLPRAVGPVANQNLHGFEDVDMIILSSPFLVDQAARIQQLHADEGLVSEIVTPMQVYNEFSSGNPDVTAVKMLMKHLYDKAQGDEDLQPKYLLLFGDGSYIGNRSVDAINSYNIITYQSSESLLPTSSFVSDDYFAFLGDDDSESQTDKLDIGVGRIPATSVTEADGYVDKLLLYVSSNTSGDGDAFCLGDEVTNPFGAWRNVLTFVSDDMDGSGGPNEVVHMVQSDEHTDSVYTKYNDYDVVKIYCDAYQQESTPGGERYPVATEAINRRVENGALIVNYVGHGGEKGWAHERILTIPTIQDWTNKNRLPLFMTATCELARFDNPEFESAGEIIVLNPDGGAIAMMTTTRIVFSGANHKLSQAFYKYALADEEVEDLTLGMISMQTKNDDLVPNSSNKRNFTLLGDPALKLAYPKYEVYTTHINEMETSLEMDTVSSLEEITIKGFVGDEAGNKLTDFNGFVYPTVYDKKNNVVTLNNDGADNPFEFEVFRNIIYKGKSSVTNGDFEFKFIIPRDINYSYGTGRVSYYAVSGDLDAHGHSEHFVIGGANEDAVLNSQGPDIELYLNDTLFVPGGITSEDPILLAKVFDENGINTVGSGIGHDIAATLDGNTANQIVLNEFYEADLDTYQSGEVRYQMSDLSEGTHNLKIKVWDVHNNSSEAFTDFVVAPSAELALQHVLNYPNPFTTRTEFFFEHNQACNVLDVQIQVFTVSGKIVKTIHKSVNASGFRTEPIVWDGKDDFGDKIGRGVYVYRVLVTTPEGQSADEFEKLVILN